MISHSFCVRSPTEASRTRTVDGRERRGKLNSYLATAGRCSQLQLNGGPLLSSEPILTVTQRQASVALAQLSHVLNLAQPVSRFSPSSGHSTLGALELPLIKIRGGNKLCRGVGAAAPLHLRRATLARERMVVAAP